MSEWERWVESLNHKDECRTLRDVVEQIAYDCIVHGGDMGPNGNVCEMVDEGIVMTDGLFDSYVERIKRIAREEISSKEEEC